MHHPRLIAALVTAVFAFLCLEVALQLVDPFQVKPYFADLALLFSETIADDARGYVLPEGVYQFSNWTATINADHSRLIPDNHASDCAIALVGDSVTFGYGVSDGDTWANVVAQRFPNVEFINTGLVGYNAAQAYATIQQTPARGFLFTLIWNDADAVVDWHRSPVPVYLPLLYAYGWVMSSQYRNVAHDYALFDSAIAGMQQMPNVAIVGFEGDELAERAGVDVVAMYTHTNSPMDGHPNAEGSVQVADAMQPTIQALIEDTCPI